MKQAIMKGMTLFTLILMDMLTGMEVDIFVPSFPEIQAYFGLTPFWVEGLLSANFIGYCISLFFAGSLADSYGRKPVLLMSLKVFVIGSILCLIGNSYPILILGRFLQGCGIAAPTILSFLIIADSYPIKEQQYLLGILNGIMNIAVAAAPLVGSYLTLYYGWQGNFVALLLLGIIVLMMTQCFISPSNKSTDGKTPLSSGYYQILSCKPLMLLILSMAFIFVPYWIFVGMSPILFMEELGVSLKSFGLYQGVWALVFAIGSIFFGLIINKCDSKKLLLIANYTFVSSIIMLALISFMDSNNPLVITLIFIPFSIASIIPTIILYPVCINYFPTLKGQIAALLQGIRLVLTAIGLQLAGYLYDRSFQNIGLIILAFMIIGTIGSFMITQNKQLIDSK